MRILVADDSQMMRKIIVKILTKLGHSTIDEAADGLEAVASMQANAADLILLDWNMPNMDGLTVAKTLRARGYKTPIIMVTTEVEKSKVLQAVQAGVNNYIIKPFTPEDMQRVIEGTLKKAAA